MEGLQAGDVFPSGVTFSYVPYDAASSTSVAACGRPIQYDASKEWADKKVVAFAVPGAFTPGCSEQHLPGYIKNLRDFHSKGVDIIAVIATNDAFVMDAWRKANGIKDEILFLSDVEGAFCNSIGWLREGSPKAVRAVRFAFVADHGKVKHAAKEPATGVSISGAEEVLKYI